MLYSLSSDNQKITAEPGTTGVCPYCRQNLVPKCGPIKTWHWSHPQSNFCDPWRDGETKWHLGWKSNFPKDYTEIIITKNRAKHIADYFNPLSNVTVEFQNSSLSLYERLEREQFYNNLQWVVHIEKDTIKDPNYEPILLPNKIPIYCDLSKCNFWWKHPKQWISVSPPTSNNIYLDGEFFPEGLLFKIAKIKTWKTRTYIDGTFVSKERFIKQLNSDV
jgi:uncharacterized Zn-finger protein